MSAAITIPDNAKGTMVRGYAEFWLDAGTDNPLLEIYDSVKPAPGDAPGGYPLVVIVLDKPSGEMVGNKWELVMRDAAGNMALVTGNAVWGRLINGNGEWAGDGDVSDEAGGGAFRLRGTGTTISAGGYIALASGGLGG